MGVAVAVDDPIAVVTTIAVAIAVVQGAVLISFNVFLLTNSGIITILRTRYGRVHCVAFVVTVAYLRMALRQFQHYNYERQVSSGRSMSAVQGEHARQQSGGCTSMMDVARMFCSEFGSNVQYVLYLRAVAVLCKILPSKTPDFV